MAKTVVAEEKTVKKIILALSAMVLGACAGEPTLQTGPEAETTFDGLVRVDNSRFSDAWADPDADWARYDQVLPGQAFFEFRAVKKTPQTTSGRINSSTDEFWIPEDSRVRLEEEVSAVFAEELANSERFTVTDAPGPNVLIIRGGLHDIVSRVPPELVGRGDIFLRSVGEATIVIEAVDSMSGEVLARMVERRSAERPGGQMQRSSPVTTWAEIRRLARRWASTLVDGMDSLPTE